MKEISEANRVKGSSLANNICKNYRREYYTEESSKTIYKQAPVETMKRNYLMFHTMALEVAIEDLREIFEQSKERLTIKSQVKK